MIFIIYEIQNTAENIYPARKNLSNKLYNSR